MYPDDPLGLNPVSPEVAVKVIQTAYNASMSGTFDLDTVYWIGSELGMSRLLPFPVYVNRVKHALLGLHALIWTVPVQHVLPRYVFEDN